jgi:hypothetical protein
LSLLLFPTQQVQIPFAAAVSCNAAGDAALATAAAEIAALSRVAVAERKGIAAAGRGRG